MSPARGSASSPSFSIPISQAPPLLLVIGLRNPTTPHHLQHGTCHFPPRVHDSLRANDSLVLSCPRWDIHPSHMPRGLFSLGGLGDRGLRLSALRHPTTAMNQLIRVCAKGTCPSSPKAPQPTTPILTGSNQAHASHSPQLSSILTTISEHKHYMSDLGAGTPSAAGQFQPQQQQTTIHL